MLFCDKSALPSGADNASATTIGDRSRQKCRLLFDVKNAVADHDTQEVGVQADFGAACRKEFVCFGAMS